MLSRWSLGTPPDAGNQRIPLPTSSCPTMPTALRSSSKSSSLIAPTSSACRLGGHWHSSSIDATPDYRARWCLHRRYTGWAGSLSPEEVSKRLEGVLRDSELPGEEFANRWLPTLLANDAPADLIEELASILADFHPRGARTMAGAMAAADLRSVLAENRDPDPIALRRGRRSQPDHRRRRALSRHFGLHSRRSPRRRSSTQPGGRRPIQFGTSCLPPRTRTSHRG